MSCYLMRNATCVKSVCTMLDVRWICLKSLKDFLHKPKLCKSLRAVRSALTETTDLLTCSDWLVYWLVLLTGFIYWFHWLVSLTGFSTVQITGHVTQWLTGKRIVLLIVAFYYFVSDTWCRNWSTQRKFTSMNCAAPYRYCSVLITGIAHCWLQVLLSVNYR